MTPSRSRRAAACAAIIGLTAGTGCSPAPVGGLPPSPPFVGISMREYAFEFRSPLPEGRVYFRVQNSGAVEHQLRLVRIPREMPPLAEQLSNPSSPRRVVETLTILPALGPGARTVFAADLQPGRYGFICFLEEPGGAPSHALRGMNADFDVGGPPR